MYSTAKDASGHNDAAACHLFEIPLAEEVRPPENNLAFAARNRDTTFFAPDSFIAVPLCV